MSISNINASPSGNAQITGGFVGSNPWSPGAGNVTAIIPVGQGTAWIVWQIRIPGLAPGEAFNGIRLQGTEDFLVSGGGGGITRVAQARVDLFHTFPEFSGTTGILLGPNVPGSGAGTQVDQVVTKAGFTSTDLVNGTIYLGISVNTNAADPGLGDGTFRTSTLSWTTYTGTDQPTPPAGAPTGYLTNPIANQIGVIAPGTMAGVDCTIIPFNNNETFVVASWSLGAGFTFAATGTTAYNQNIGSPQLWKVNCGVINVAGSVVPGTYPISCNVGPFAGFGSLLLRSNLVVVAAGTGWFWEV